jgi:ribosome-binding factor A
MPREFSRNQRLGNQLLRTLSEFLRTDVKDPRLDGVSLTAVDLSRDLSTARVYFSVLDPGRDIGPVTDGLASAAGFLRGRLGRAIKVRHVPELRFVHDDSAAKSAYMSRLIDTAVGDGPATDDEQD